MSGKDVDEIEAALNAEFTARERQREIGELIQQEFRAGRKPTTDQIAALRTSTIEFMEAGRALIAALDKANT
jgi:hypothetical protein